jgi:hypothetical protein
MENVMKLFSPTLPPSYEFVLINNEVMVKVELIRGLISICATFPVHFGNLKDAC